MSSQLVLTSCERPPVFLPRGRFHFATLNHNEQSNLGGGVSKMAIIRPEKVAAIADMKKQMSDDRVVVFTDFSGISVKQDNK